MADPVSKVIIVKASPDQAFSAWSEFEMFPRFMKHICSVTKTSADTSHWEMKAGLGRTIAWDARLTRYEPGQRIAWNSTGGDIETTGMVTFTALPKGETEVTVTLKYVPPAGKIGEAVAKLLDQPASRLEEDLRRFKDHLEGRRAA